MQVEPNWKKIVVINEGWLHVYDLDEYEKLSYKFRRKKNRKDVTKQYKLYLLAHPNV